jgi:hypothetical protein
MTIILPLSCQVIESGRPTLSIAIGIMATIPNTTGINDSNLERVQFDNLICCFDDKFMIRSSGTSHQPSHL